MKIFISGPITNDANYKSHFNSVAEVIKAKGHIPLNPAVYPKGLTINEYMSLGFKMIDIADAVCMLEGWESSGGANVEYEYASYCDKLIIYERDILDADRI